MRNYESKDDPNEPETGVKQFQRLPQLPPVNVNDRRRRDDDDQKGEGTFVGWMGLRWRQLTEPSILQFRFIKS